MPFADYAKIDAINWSTLREMRRSPRHYRYRLEVPREDAAHLALGRGAHTAILEPDRFPLDYVVFDGPRRAGKVWEDFAAANASRTILKREEYELCLAMRDAVRAHPIAAPLLSDGAAEQSITWTDERTGLPCKGRIDWLTDRLIIDLKTTREVEARRLGATAARLGYHCQLAFYREGMRRVTGKMLKVYIIAVEQEAPHDVGVFELNEDALYAGDEECAELLGRVAECRSSGSWPGRYPVEQVLDMPAWVWGNDEDDLIGGGR